MAFVSIPLVIAFPQWSLLVAVLALCAYPILDVPRILARPSWWRGAVVSAGVWLAVFAGLVSTVEAVRHPGEDAMIFLLPFTMYPLVLAVSGLVRLEGRFSGRPRESGPRLAAIAGAIACALMVGEPIAFGTIPVVLEKITGSSPRNSVTSEEGEVMSAAPAQVTVRLAGGAAKSFHLGPDTKFDFRGPGSALVKGPADAAWLKPGQRIGLEYVTRRFEAQAQLVTIWIERKGCRGDAKWSAATRAGTPSPTAVPSLEGTTWDSVRASQDEGGRKESTTFEFLAVNQLAFQTAGEARYTNGAWRQDGPAVLVEVNDCYAEYEGRIEGDVIKDEFWNEVGAHEGWTARRR